jgi:RNA polymerase sigma-70 factor, ECF subfamily
MIEAAADPAQTLLLRAAAGEPDAARALLDTTAPIVYGFVYARVGGDRQIAEDLVQATYLEAMRSASGYRGDAALETWLCAIARRQVARHFESERRRARLDRKLQLVAMEHETEGDVPESALADGDAMIEALGRLMPLHRQVLVLKYLDELSVEEIAAELKRPRVQIQSLLQRARAGLKRALAEPPDA